MKKIFALCLSLLIAFSIYAETENKEDGTDYKCHKNAVSIINKKLELLPELLGVKIKGKFIYAYGDLEKAGPVHLQEGSEQKEGYLTDNDLLYPLYFIADENKGLFHGGILVVACDEGNPQNVSDNNEDGITNELDIVWVEDILVK